MLNLLNLFLFPSIPLLSYRSDHTTQDMTTVCAACSNPLLVQIEPDSDEEDLQQSSSTNSSSANLVPDDCALGCGHHFHWDCIIESFESTACPACGTNLATTSQDGRPQLLIDLKNEGGLQHNHDILPTIREESYVRQHPDERKPRAFLEYCRTGDVPAMVEMLQDDDNEDEDEDEGGKRWRAPEIMLYQDGLNNGWSPLHTAISHKRQEVAWLLLLLGSSLDRSRFPTEVMQEGLALGLDMSVTLTEVDIRTIRDTQGTSAEQLASQVGEPWTAWLGQGLLAT